MLLKTAYSYVRVSTPGQLAGDSLNRQISKARAYAKTHKGKKPAAAKGAAAAKPAAKKAAAKKPAAKAERKPAAKKPAPKK